MISPNDICLHLCMHACVAVCYKTTTMSASWPAAKFLHL